MKQYIPLIIQIALFLLVSSVALRARWRDVLAAANDPKMLGKAVIAVNVVVPLVAVILCALLPLEPAIATGIVIMAVSPLAPLVPGKLLKAGMHASAVIGLYVVLILAAIVLVPATLALLSALFPADATVSPLAIAELIATRVLVPAVAGLVVAEIAPDFAERLAGPFSIAGSLALALILVLILYAQGGQIVSLVGDGAIVAIVLTTVAGLVAGHLLGGPDQVGKTSLALAATTRHPGIALMIANANFTDKRVGLAVMLYLLASVVVGSLYQAWLKRSNAHSAASGK